MVYKIKRPKQKYRIVGEWGSFTTTKKNYYHKTDFTNATGIIKEIKKVKKMK
jgi:hypothetical protein